MSKKKCLNQKCDKELESKNPKAKYCDSKCRAAHQYQQKLSVKSTPSGDLEKKKERLKKIHPSIKTADELPKKIALSDAEEQNLDLGKRFRELCDLKKCNVEDGLVWFEENYGNKQSFKKFIGGKKEKEEKSSSIEPYWKRRGKLKNKATE